MKSRPFNPKTCARGADEVDNERDSELALGAAAAHLAEFAKAHGVELELYDGGIAPHAPVAHAEHVHDFLFARQDLAFLVGDVPGGTTIAKKTYDKLLKAVNAAGVVERGRRSAVRDWLIRSQGALKPLASLGAATRGSPVEVLVGGPMTGLFSLAKSDADFASRVARVRAMAGAWDSSTANLFANQFNVAADLAAAAALLGPAADSPLGDAPITLYTTEFCKAALSLSPADVRAHATQHVADLYDLWHELTGARGAVTIFDVSSLLDAIADRPLAATVPVTCALRSDGVFALAEAPASRIRATTKVLADDDRRYANAQLLALLDAAKRKAPVLPEPEMIEV